MYRRRALLAVAIVGSASLVASPTRAAVSVAGSVGLGSPTGRFDGFDTKAELGPILGLALERELHRAFGLQVDLQVAWMDGPGVSLEPNMIGSFELSARQVTFMAGPTLHLATGRLDLSLHLPVGYFVSNGREGLGAFDGPGSAFDLDLSGYVVGAEAAAFFVASPSMSAGVVASYTYRWATQRREYGGGVYDRGFVMGAFALRWRSAR
jgi:hypothetical protein